MTAVTAVTVILGYPAAVIPAGEHPVNAKCRRRIYPPFSACKTTPAVRKILPIFPTAFTGCSPAGQSRQLYTALSVNDSNRGYPNIAVTTVTAVTRPLCKRNLPAVFFAAVLINDMVLI